MSDGKRHCKAIVVVYLFSNGKVLHYSLKQHRLQFVRFFSFIGCVLLRNKIEMSLLNLKPLGSVVLHM